MSLTFPGLRSRSIRFSRAACDLLVNVNEVNKLQFAPALTDVYKMSHVAFVVKMAGILTHTHCQLWEVTTVDYPRGKAGAKTKQTIQLPRAANIRKRQNLYGLYNKRNFELENYTVLRRMTVIIKPSEQTVVTRHICYFRFSTINLFGFWTFLTTAYFSIHGRMRASGKWKILARLLANNKIIIRVIHFGNKQKQF